MNERSKHEIIMSFSLEVKPPEAGKTMKGMDKYNPT
jgi:hypothetical protein